MSERSVAIETSVGIIRGRDAIYFDAVGFDYPTHRIAFRGSLNPRLCSLSPGKDEWLPYELSFDGLLGLRMTELDFADISSASSFDEVLHSEWIRSLRARDHSAKVQPDYRHFVLATYDDVFELISTGFHMQIGEPISD